MADHIPAWKRIGLKVKQSLIEDPLSVTTHLESANLSQTQKKKIKEQKKIASAINLENSSEKDISATKKPPKRVKLPKGERAPPPEKDQLLYLRQYHEDRENWKFSKQKQNWILKNIKEIPQSYNEALEDYLKGLQGGSKDRIIESLKEVIEKWNIIAAKAELKIKKRLEDIAAGRDVSEEEKSRGKSDKSDKNKKNVADKEEEEVPDQSYVLKARDLIKLISNEDVPIISLTSLEKSEESEPSVETNAESAEESIGKDVDEKEEVVEKRENQKADKNEEEEDGDQQTNEIDHEKEETGLSIEPLQKKSKKKKRKDSDPKDSNPNVIVETVEVSDFVGEADLKDPPQVFTRLDIEGKKRKAKDRKKERTKRAKQSN